MFSGQSAAARGLVARLGWGVMCAALGACVTEKAVFGLVGDSAADGGVQASMASGPENASKEQAGSAAVGGSAGGAPAAAAGSGDVEGIAHPEAQFMNLAPKLGAPLIAASPLSPPAPAGWAWYAIEGATCRDGSPTGIYVHTGEGPGLAIFLEGGGACLNEHFCAFNPVNVESTLAGDGSTVLSGTLGLIPGRQEPGVYSDITHAGVPAGIHDFSNPQNPFKEWSHVYVPFCTGDLHFGTQLSGAVPNLDPQQFAGYLNMRRFIARIVPTFENRVSRVILTGSSAGGYGALLNYSMVQDAFGPVPVDVIADSGFFLSDTYLPACLQKRWRELWGFDTALPGDCKACASRDGGDLLALMDFVLAKHPRARIALLSGTQDEMIRMFYSAGLNDCAGYDDADPAAITAGQVFDPQLLFSAQEFSAGLDDLRARYRASERVATYYLGAPTPNVHQHLFRAGFYSELAGGQTPAQFVRDFVAGRTKQIGP